MPTYKTAAQMRDERIRVRDEYLSTNAKRFDCEPCAAQNHKMCVRPCYCKHLQKE